MLNTVITKEITHFHFCCGLGGGAKGFNAASPRVGNMQAKFRCLGGVDNDPAAIRDFDRLSGARGTVLDLFTREQYTAFHGREPAPSWREASIADIRKAAQNENPRIVFISSPCKGASGLLSEKQRSATLAITVSRKHGDAAGGLLTDALKEVKSKGKTRITAAAMKAPGLTDKQRLNWLEAHMEASFHRCFCMGLEHIEARDTAGELLGKGEDLRAAIDAAMRAQEAAQ